MNAHRRPIKRLLTISALATLLGTAMVTLSPHAQAGTIDTIGSGTTTIKYTGSIVDYLNAYC
ncbi:MAG: hypothetical protein B7X01_04140, partial [Acidiphilium sp. 21-62-4]